MEISYDHLNKFCKAKKCVNVDKNVCPQSTLITVMITYVVNLNATCCSECKSIRYVRLVITCCISIMFTWKIQSFLWHIKYIHGLAKDHMIQDMVLPMIRLDHMTYMVVKNWQIFDHMICEWPTRVEK